VTDGIDLDSFQRPGPFPGDPKGDYPTLHDWKPLRSGSTVRLSGSVRNHSRLPDGEIVTSPLRDIACDRSWCRTFNTLYLLGQQVTGKTAAEGPPHSLPLLLRLLLAEDWVSAAKIACDATMAHWLLLDGQANSDFVEIRFNADAMSLDEGQRRAAAIHNRIADGDMPHAVVEAWQALAAETSSPDTCARTAAAGSAAYDRWFTSAAEGETAKVLRRRLNGWRELADDARRPLNGAEPDQFKLANTLGQEDPAGDEEPAEHEGGRPDSLRLVEDMRPETLAWFAATMMTRSKAVRLVVEINRTRLAAADCAEGMAAVVRQNGFDEPVSTSKAVAMSREFQNLATKLRGTSLAPVYEGLAGAWTVLGADLSGRRNSFFDAARQISRAAQIHARSLLPQDADAFRSRSAVLIAAWALISAQPEGVPGEPNDDPIATAHFHMRRLRRAISDGPDDVGEPASEPAVGSVMVLASVGGTSQTSTGKEAQKEFESIAGRPVPLVPVPDLAKARSKLAAEFPYALPAIDFLLADIANQQHVFFRPSLILGSPGGGKTRLIRRLGEALGVYVARFDGSGSSDNAFGGTPRRWSSGEPCVPLNAIRSSGIANPICHVDEIDKAGSSRHNGSLTQALLPMCEQESSKRFADPYVQSDINLSFVSFLLTANDDTALPAPLRDRLRVIRIPLPGIEHVPALSHGIVADIMAEKGADRFSFPLNGEELHIAAELWRKGGSIRKLRAIIERLLARRDQQAPRH
jgi:ATPase family associated with various cellular activities (AAA)